MVINKEILVYANLPYKKYRWISYISVIQVGFIALNLFVLPTRRLVQERQEALKNRVRRKEIKEKSQDGYVDEFEINPDYDDATVFQRLKRLNYRDLFTLKNVSQNISDRPLFSAGVVLSMGMVSAAFFTYARRIIHKVTLLPNERVRLAFFSAFALGKPKTLELPLHNISCVSSRHSKHNYAILKIKNYLGYHLIQKTEGQFLQPKLYDKYLGFERSWAKK